MSWIDRSFVLSDPDERIVSKPPRLKKFMVKFLFDTTLAAILLIVLSPVWIICILLVRLGSRGPAIFRQVRVGQHQTPFACYKFRTMYMATENVPTHEVSHASITPLGQFLRRSKLDELPQLLNVVCGQMSFVGPRPCLPQQAELIECRRKLCVFDVRPGITGLAQIQGIDMSEPARLAEVDGDYVRTRSLLGDIGIMVATVLGKGQGDKVRTGKIPPGARTPRK